MDKPGYCCAICDDPAEGKNSWFDQFGLKCISCQHSIDRNEVPPTITKDKESYYTLGELKYYFNLTPPVLRHWVKQGRIILRTMTRDNKKPHLKLCLGQDNPGMLLPKGLLQSQTVIEVIDGKEWYVSRPWYEFVDPNQYLKGYKILDHLEFIPEEPSK
jgi:hypothetical protein